MIEPRPPAWLPHDAGITIRQAVEPDPDFDIRARGGSLLRQFLEAIAYVACKNEEFLIAHLRQLGLSRLVAVIVARLLRGICK